jgi:hypothetical protein
MYIRSLCANDCICTTVALKCTILNWILYVRIGDLIRKAQRKLTLILLMWRIG